MAGNASSRRWPSAGRRSVALALAGAFAVATEAQIRTDGTLGGPSVALSGPSFLIGEALGRLAGSNLFHSFQVFNVGTKESATFVTTTPGLANVISRVTGGSQSQINGLVRLTSTNAAPNFVFINPAGIVFGKGAQINVPAGFHVSTANYVKFPDGNFYADPNAVSALSSAAPEAFGFLGTTRAAITIKDGARLQTPSAGGDQPIGIVAGDIDIDNAQVQTAGSDIRAIAVGSGARDIGLSGPLPGAFGELRVRRGGFVLSIPAGAAKAGDVLVSAGTVLIDGGGNDDAFTAVGSQTSDPARGDAGNVTINATGTLALINGGAIVSDSYSSGRAGTVTVKADTLTVDSGGSGGFTGISSDAVDAGNAGKVDLTVRGTLSIVDAGQISSGTFGSGNAGTVKVSAGSVAVGAAGSTDGGAAISSQANEGSTGNAGSVDLTVSETLSIVNGGAIAAATYASGHAGTVRVLAGALVIDSSGAGSFTGISSDAVAGSGRGGSIDVTTQGTLSIVNGGRMTASTRTSGNAGSVKVSAGTLLIGSGGQIQSGTSSAGEGGTVSVAARDMVIDGQGSANEATGIFSQATGGTGNAGSVDVTASGTLSIINGGRISTATGTSGNSGAVQISAGRLSLASGGSIDSSTESSGNAGAVTVAGGDITLDGQGSNDATGIASRTERGSGNAGSVDVTASGTLTIVNGGIISSSTLASGQGGKVKVTARDLIIDGQGSTKGTGISSVATSLTDGRAGTGNAGTVEVAVARDLTLLRGGQIVSDTLDRSAGDAGGVKVSAGTLTIDGNGSAFPTGIFSGADETSSGNAGGIAVTTAGALSIVNGGRIDTSTASAGRAGTIKVTAGDLSIDRRDSTFSTGITSQAASGSRGDAGGIDVTAEGGLSILNGGSISSSTFASGRAGSVRVNAGGIAADSNGFIGAAAAAGSSGQTGTVTIEARTEIALSNGATFSIQNNATAANPGNLSPTLLTVTAPNITLASDGQITAASSGNVPASGIHVNFGPQLTVSNARISTSANDGNGGSIAVTGTGVLVLQNGQITTSVAGTQGNGGDISVEAPILVMQTGFIQANTAAANASGGNVNIEVGTLLPSGGTLFVGGSTPYAFAPGVFGFNVIQAAAPTGVSGTIRIATPVLDITGSLSALPSGYLDTGGLGRSPCAIVGGSSLSQAGRGGLPPAAGDLLWIDPVLEFPAIPAAGSPGSGTWVPPYRAAGTNARTQWTPCWS